MLQVFDDCGNFVRRVSIRFIHIAAGLATTSDGRVVVVDSVSRTIFIIDPDTGNLVQHLDCSGFMNEPSDIAIFKDDFYVCDFKVRLFFKSYHSTLVAMSVTQCIAVQLLRKLFHLHL